MIGFLSDAWNFVKEHSGKFAIGCAVVTCTAIAGMFSGALGIPAAIMAVIPAWLLKALPMIAGMFGGGSVFLLLERLSRNQNEELLNQISNIAARVDGLETVTEENAAEFQSAIVELEQKLENSENERKRLEDCEQTNKIQAVQLKRVTDFFEDEIKNKATNKVKMDTKFKTIEDEQAAMKCELSDLQTEVKTLRTGSNVHPLNVSQQNTMFPPPVPVQRRANPQKENDKKILDNTSKASKRGVGARVR